MSKSNGQAMAQRHGAVVEQVGDVAVLHLSRPPSNALPSEFCTYLSSLLAGAMEDLSLQGAVIASDLPVFAAGSDVADVLDPPMGHRNALRALCAQIAAAPKPIIAAIAGPCLSTGLDLALAARARVGGTKASFGYPDIRLGLLPAAGGAVRLTHIVGAQMAHQMLLAGDEIDSETALEVGLLDQLCAYGGEVTQAIDMVRNFAQAGPIQRRPDMAADLATIAGARAKLPDRMGQGFAQSRMLDVIEAALLLAPNFALIAAHAAHDEVQRGEIARALTYAFVARQRGTSDGAERAQITAQLRRVMAQVVVHFENRSMPRADVLGAMAAFGIGVPQGADSPACPKGAEDVMPALMTAWANLGAKLLRTGAAPRGDFIDLAALTGGMCPNWRGGPIFAADARGPMIMRADLRRRANAASANDAKASAAGPTPHQEGDLFTPDPAWDFIIARGLRLGEYSAAPDRV